MLLFSSRNFELINIIKQERIEIGNQITSNTFMVARLKAVLKKISASKIRNWIHANDTEINTVPGEVLPDWQL